MNRAPRRLARALAASLLAAAPAAAAGGLAAELVVLDANVITVDAARPRAEAFAVRDGRFALVGDARRVREAIGPRTRVLELGGRTVTPGFVDAHLHPRPEYPWDSRLGQVDLSPASVATLDELVEALRAKAALTPPEEWVLGTGYQDTKLGRHPTRGDLDRASVRHPIYIRHSSNHVAAVNSLALEQAGISRETPDPPGGGFDRDASGRPDGVCREDAGARVLEAGPPLPQATRAEELEGIRRTFRAFLREGITSIHDAAATPDSLRLYQDARAAGEPLRVSLLMRDAHLDELAQLGLRSGFGDARLRLGGIKVFHGNSLSGRTCWLYEPYADRPDYFGIPPARSQEELDRLIFAIHEAGLQAAVHSNGDREIDMVLDAFEKALARLPREDHRHRIEHASVTSPRILERVKKLGLVLALHSYVYEHGDKMEAYGEARFAHMHANRSALDLGIPVAGNSDWPVSAADPLLRIQSLVTRRSAEGRVYGPEQRITPEEAIRVFTLGGAFASFEEREKGSIEPGKWADFAVLSADPTTAAPGRIGEIEVELTAIAGEIVHEKPRSAPAP